MKTTKVLYHFLDPDFGYPFVQFFYKKKLYHQFNIVLIFSTKALKRNRRSWNPMRLFDFITFQKNKKKIIKKYKPFGFPVIFSANVNTDSFIGELTENAFGICTGFNQIFKLQLIKKLENFVNIHPSLLPFYRGPTPVEWCVANKEQFTGWTLHRINEKIDDGEILFQEVVEMKSKAIAQIKSELSHQASEVLFDYLDKKRKGKEFKIIKVDSGQYYQNRLSYKSFYQ